MQIVVFRINEEQFAVESSGVQSINDMMEVTLVPKAPDYIKGLINLRGNVISLLDLELLLEIEKSTGNKNSIIILNVKDELVGIAVDEVNEVLEIEDAVIKRLVEDNKNAYIKGVINFTDRIVTLIDIDKLLTK